MLLLAVNCGSSTLKFRLYEMPEEKVITKGSFERIGSPDSDYTIRVNDEKVYLKREIKTHKEAVDILLTTLVEKGIVKRLDDIKAVGHRIVHGGSLYSHSVIITDRVINELEDIKDLAPLHNPAAITGIKAFMEEIPTSTMVACFDTAFHQTIEEKNFLYSVPYEWYVKYGVRKYGFHGLSHQYITNRMKTILGHDGNLIICHIGNGASISAVKEGKCIDTSMGFTPLAGVMMGTRSGDIDPSIIPYVMEKEGLNAKEVVDILNKKSGLLGVSEKFSDYRDIRNAINEGDEQAILANKIFVNTIVKYIANYYVELEGIDALVFTAGVGENSSPARHDIISKLKVLGMIIDEEKNNIIGEEVELTGKDSKVRIFAIPTNEELMIALDTLKLIK